MSTYNAPDVRIWVDESPDYRESRTGELRQECEHIRGDEEFYDPSPRYGEAIVCFQVS
jgi:hypothetical protein